MGATIAVLEKVNTLAFCVLAVACLRQWSARKTDSTRWAAIAFGSLGAISLIGLALHHPPVGGMTIWLIKGLLVVLIMFPYFLYRFATAFERPPRLIRLAAMTVTFVAVGWSLTLSRFAVPGLPEPPGWAAYKFVIEAQWMLLFSTVAWRLWRAGRHETTVPRRRIRTLALATLGLNLAVFLSGVSSIPQSPSTILVTQLLSLVAAGLFFIGLAPPNWLVYVWRRPEALAFQRATGALFRAGSLSELSETLLPRAVGLVGGRGGMFISPAGEVIGTSGQTDTVENIARILASPTAPMGQSIQRLTLSSGTLVIWTSPYAPFFGDGELEMTQALGVFADTVMERCALASQQREVEGALAYQALHDSLTGLPNRDLFLDRLAQALAGLNRRGSSLSVHFLDLDHFKGVNDIADHEAGDAVLVAAADRVAQAVRRGDTVARFGGDEFVVLAEVTGEAEALALADRLVDAISEPFTVGGRDFSITASVGVAVTSDEADAMTLVRDADAAMYHAKGAGRARVELFDEEMRTKSVECVELEQRLRHCTHENALRLHYQPIVRLADGAVVGVEALVRWQHPELGLLAPAAFIPIAEQSNLIVDVGTWVLDEACRQAAVWHRTIPGFEDCVVWVNVSAAQFSRMDVPGAVMNALGAAGLGASGLGLEITESVFIDESTEMAATFQRLDDLGVSIAIDDFGTGFSSLGSLKRFPARVLKVDGSFVRGLDGDPEDAPITTACVALSKSLQMTAVAEGVESANQCARLIELGYEFGQGFYFSRPLPADEIDSYLWAHTTSAQRPLVRESV
jgi:diguanylate cyclase (GGDEF)-like protein